MRVAVILFFCAFVGLKIMFNFCPKNTVTVLEIDKEFESHFITIGNKSYREKEIIVEAAKYWNDIGTSLVLPEQLYGTEINNNYHHLKITRSDYAMFGILGRYNVLSGNIVLFPKYWSIKKYSINTVKSIVAHEIGHSFGLWHLRNKDSVMYKHPSSLNKLSPDDIREFNEGIF